MFRHYSSGSVALDVSFEAFSVDGRLMVSPYRQPCSAARISLSMKLLSLIYTISRLNIVIRRRRVVAAIAGIRKWCWRFRSDMLTAAAAHAGNQLSHSHYCGCKQIYDSISADDDFRERAPDSSRNSRSYGREGFSDFAAKSAPHVAPFIIIDGAIERSRR